MQIDSVTRQSGLFAALLLLLLVVAAITSSALRTSISPAGVPLWLDAVATALLLIVTGMIIGRMSIKAGIFRTFCTLPIPMFGIIACAAGIDAASTDIAAAALCTAIALLFFSESIIAPDAKNPVFFGSILLGGTALLYPPCVVLVLLLPLLVAISAQSFRQIIIACTGWLLPLFAVSYISWYAGNDFLATAHGIANALATPATTADALCPNVLSIAVFAIVAVLILSGIVLRYMDKATMLVDIRKSLQLQTFALLILLCTFAMPCRSAAIAPVLAVPAAVLASSTLERGRSDIATIIYWLLLLLSALRLFIG